MLKAGDHVVAQTNHYMASAKHFSELLPRFGVRCTLVDQTDLAQWQRAIAPGTRLVMTETPVNPTCALTDLAAVARLARAQGALSVCDNTFASPLNQQPLALGIDVVVHSATKYLGGHHDLTAGAVIGPRALIDALWPTQICLGATLSPMDAWLLLAACARWRCACASTTPARSNWRAGSSSSRGWSGRSIRACRRTLSMPWRPRR